MKTCDQLQTIAVAYAEICRGEDPWIALGNFMNDWFDYAKDGREQLVTDPLSIPEPLTLDLHRWAAFCAASVQWLCQRYTLPCPPWVHHPIFPRLLICTLEEKRDHSRATKIIGGTCVLS